MHKKVEYTGNIEHPNETIVALIVDDTVVHAATFVKGEVSEDLKLAQYVGDFFGEGSK